MNLQEAIKSQITQSFGAAAQVRPRRPGKLYQIDLPAFLADGDGVSVYVEPTRDGVRMTDLGQTTMRLSYSHKLTKSVMDHLGRLAETHGFRVESGDVVAEFSNDEIAAAAFGLVQIQSEAEAAIGTAVVRQERAESFRATVRKALMDIFAGACELDFRAANDPDGIFPVDAVITGLRRPVGVAITPNDVHAERAVAVKLHAEGAMDGGTLWIALPRDINELSAGSRSRLMSEYLAPVPRFDDAGGLLQSKITRLAS